LKGKHLLSFSVEMPFIFPSMLTWQGRRKNFFYSCPQWEVAKQFVLHKLLWVFFIHTSMQSHTRCSNEKSLTLRIKCIALIAIYIYIFPIE
jgi:hypothetical protein